MTIRRRAPASPSTPSATTPPDPIAAMRRVLGEQTEKPVSPELKKILHEVAAAAVSAQKEFKALSAKLRPHAGMTADRGEDVMMLREVLDQQASLCKEIEDHLKTEFGV